jgi:RNA polymerase sigma-70 factor (ECF subfamily)
MDQECESDIARGLRVGRSEAWLELYDAHAERIWRFVARLTAPHAQDVPDVVQEIFLAAARSARTYDPARGSLWSWLSGIARRQVALHFRQRAKQPIPVAVNNDASTTSEPVDEHGPADAAQSAELARQVRDALTSLSVDYEVLLTAKYIDGASTAEIARSDNTTVEAVRSKLARARRAFRRSFEGGKRWTMT